MSYGISDEEILSMIRTGWINVRLDKAQITKYDGLVYKPYLSEGGYQYLGIMRKRRKRTISVHYLVWMAEHNRILPPSFEIHHLDFDPQNNVAGNLIAVTRTDHAKLHQLYASTPPF